MDVQHDKGIALPRKTMAERRARGGQKTNAHANRDRSAYQKARWDQGMKALDLLRENPDGMDLMLISAAVGVLPTPLRGILETLRKRGRVTCQLIGDDRDGHWTVPARERAEIIARRLKQSADAAKAIHQWTVNSISARSKAGIAVSASYPFVRAEAS